MLGAESVPLLSFGKTRASHLLLRRKLQELGRKVDLGLGQSQYRAKPVAGTQIGSTLAVQPLLSEKPGLCRSRCAALSPAPTLPCVSLYVPV